MEIGASVRVTEYDSQYPHQFGTVEKIATREDRIYVGLRLPGIGHLVWRFADDLTSF